MANSKDFSDWQLMELGEARDDHVWNNRDEIAASQLCMCTACYFRFPPSAIKKWQDEKSAVCPSPECGFGGSVIGSESGLNFDDYDYSSSRSKT